MPHLLRKHSLAVLQQSSPLLAKEILKYLPLKVIAEGEPLEVIEAEAREAVERIPIDDLERIIDHIAEQNQEI
jgi:hypothetical protein